MPTAEGTLNSIIQEAGQLDPALRDALIKLAQELIRIGLIVDPPPVSAKKTPSARASVPDSVLNFTYTFTPNNIVLSWEAPAIGIFLYELRKGTDWDFSDKILITANDSVIIDPLLIGTHTYLLRTIDSLGNYSEDIASVEIVITPIAAPALTVQNFGNSVAVDWEAPSSIFRIEYYRITKDGFVIIERNPGTFFARQEAVGGVIEYGVTAVDIAGNESTETLVAVELDSPTDFDFQDDRTSGFTGTIVNGKAEGNRLIVAINLTETYENHFTTRSWASPQAQVTAGYPLWLSPTLTTASYQEIFDFGVIFSNVIVNLNYQFEIIAGAFTFGIDVRVSDDNVTYSSAYTVNSFMVPSARYVKVKVTFTGSDDKAMLAFYNFVVALSVKREVDGGEADVFAADTTGTIIEFNKAFKSVESITVTPLETVVREWVYDFDGGFNPTEFMVYLWNSAGTRVNGTVSWKARGVL